MRLIVEADIAADKRLVVTPSNEHLQKAGGEHDNLAALQAILGPLDRIRDRFMAIHASLRGPEKVPDAGADHIRLIKIDEEYQLGLKAAEGYFVYATVEVLD